MITLEEKGLSGYKSHMISFSKKEHKEENVTKLNPRGQVGSARIFTIKGDTACSIVVIQVKIFKLKNSRNTTSQAN